MVMELGSKINFLQINVKLNAISAIVDIFVGNPYSYNCQHLFSLDRHLYEEISSNNCHSTNWGDTFSSLWNMNNINHVKEMGTKLQ